MAEKKRDEIVPAFNGGLLNARYLKGGVFVRKTRAQRNQIGLLFRVLDGAFSTLCFVSAENILYELISNPSTETTSDSDWKISLQIQSGLSPIGTWDVSNTDPELEDADAVGLNGSFYFVTGAASPVLVNFPELFGGASKTVKNGDLIVSNDTMWFVSSLSITWDTLDKPSVIVDYVNGEVIAHTHIIDDVTGLQAALDEKFDENDVAPLDEDFDTIPDLELINLGFLKQYYYRKSEVYSKDEVDGLIPDLSNYYTKSEIDFLDDALLEEALNQVSMFYYNKETIDEMLASALSNVPGLIIGEVTLAGRNALIGGVSTLNGYLLHAHHRVITTDPDDLKWVDEFTGANNDTGSTFWARLYIYAGQGVSQFRELSDAPDSYVGAAGKSVVVKEDQTGLEFKDSSEKKQVVTTGGTLTFDFQKKSDRVFFGSATIAAAKTWAFSNSENAAKFVFLFQISGEYGQQMGPSVIMDDVRFDNGTKIWTPSGDLGKYKAEGYFDGTNIWLDISKSIYI